ncbi:unnamed protein product [Moneuplotes crassus]|uniref:Uncharacterized protein n=1 Tax=Euplotes crassus TaxID=5936 RepID=A0AAD1Y8S3_EUPCR|nr:unnamed protein product [Moneuplotes crassus]
MTHLIPHHTSSTSISTPSTTSLQNPHPPKHPHISLYHTLDSNPLPQNLQTSSHTRQPIPSKSSIAQKFRTIRPISSQKKLHNKTKLNLKKVRPKTAKARRNPSAKRTSNNKKLLEETSYTNSLSKNTDKRKKKLDKSIYEALYPFDSKTGCLKEGNTKFYHKNKKNKTGLYSINKLNSSYKEINFCSKGFNQRRVVQNLSRPSSVRRDRKYKIRSKLSKTCNPVLILDNEPEKLPLSITTNTTNFPPTQDTTLHLLTCANDFLHLLQSFNSYNSNQICTSQLHKEIGTLCMQAKEIVTALRKYIYCVFEMVNIEELEEDGIREKKNEYNQVNTLGLQNHRFRRKVVRFEDEQDILKKENNYFQKQNKDLEDGYSSDNDLDISSEFSREISQYVLTLILILINIKFY